MTMLKTKPKKFHHEDETFDSLRISIASSEQIRSWSFGEIKKPDTINYRTFKPERDGLFCARIFGPVKDYECLCGKYKRIKHKGIVCEKCGVEVTLSRVRRERMGHIELAAPVSHIWFLKSQPSKVSSLLNMELKDVEKILYFENYVVLEPGLTPLRMYQLLSEDEYYKFSNEYGEDGFTTVIGAQAIKILLSKLDLPHEKQKCIEEIKKTQSDNKRKKITKRLKIIDGFLTSQIKPEWMIMEVIPVLPPELRPLVPLENGRFATSDLNDLYRRVINRNNRLKRLIELKSPEIILRNEKRMLQEAVDTLFDNGRRGRVIMNSSKRPLKSLADMLKGKQGRFRQNLLGKRVDFSGRSVIIPGPELKLHECGLPKRMALELFKPMIYAKLLKYGKAGTLKTAKRMVEKERSEVWDILEEVVHEYPVLLNRAPTLHRLGIQAFEVILVEGKAIQLHPLVCTAFNADFDGDQMAVHIPLSLEAQLEARVLMMSTNNILSPANGKPIIIPSQDIVLGLYYLSLEQSEALGAGKVFSGLEEIEAALQAGVLDLQAPIQSRYSAVDDQGQATVARAWTTAGRMLLYEIVPRHKNLGFHLINQILTKKEVTNLLDTVYRNCGQKKTVIFSDQLMRLGLKYACLSGISIGKDDLVIPSIKQNLIKTSHDKIKEFEHQYQEGLILHKEKQQRIIDVWSECTDKVSQEVTKTLAKSDAATQRINSVHMMVHSGARGSTDQVKQLAGMRGLIAKPSGAIIETPIISSFKEGLTVLEYFNSSHGARKGLADTALKTSNAGYLTRRLVDVAQDCIIREEDCGSTQGITFKNAVETGAADTSFYDNVLGRVTVNPVISQGQVLIPANTLLEESDIEKLQEAKINSVTVRSVLGCRAKKGICARCYGRDLARGQVVNQGEAVGIIAAQSIGEPGTQLTMRTFHTGGTAQRGTKQSHIQAAISGQVEFVNLNVLTNSQGDLIVIGRNCELLLTNTVDQEEERYQVPYGSRLFVRENDMVEHKQKLAEWDPYTVPIITEQGGIIKYKHLARDISLRQVIDDVTAIGSQVVSDWRGLSFGNILHPQLQIFEKRPCVLRSEHKGTIEIPDYEASVVNDVVIGTSVKVSFKAKAKRSISYDVPYGATLKVKPGDSVKKDQVLGEWDPYVKPLVAPHDGVIKYEDLLPESSFIDSVSVDDSFVQKRVVINWQQAMKNAQPRLVLTDSNNKKVEFRLRIDDVITVENNATVKAGDVLVQSPQEPLYVYHLQPGTTLSVEENTEVEAGDVLARMSRESSKTIDITHSTAGLPRVIELFEARKPKDSAYMAKCDGQVTFSREHRNKRCFILLDLESGQEFEYQVGRDKHLLIQDGDRVKRGDLLTEGSPDPHDIIEVLGIEALARYLIDQIQSVYRLQGVKINNKHLEVIIRQMLQKVQIIDPGDSLLLAEELLDRLELDKLNQKLQERRENPATSRPILQGITKASLQTHSFISAASFQETTRTLTDAACCGKLDPLQGLKENVIIGHLIPAGTGYIITQLKQEAKQERAKKEEENGPIEAEKKAAS